MHLLDKESSMIETKTKLLELTNDVIFKSFMLDEETNNYKAELINYITGILRIYY